MTIDPTSTPQWQALATHFGEVGDLHLRELFANDPERTVRLTAEAGDLVVSVVQEGLIRLTGKPRD